jgi:hypothetical protein
VVAIGSAIWQRKQVADQEALAAQLRRDHEDRALGAPIEPPPKLFPDGKKSGQPVVDLYLRAPRGINSQYSTKVGDIMWRYPQGQASTCPLLAMYVAVSTAMDRDQFWQEVQTPFMPVDLSGITTVTKTPRDGPPLEFEYDSRTVEERRSSKSFFIYVYRADLPDKVARVAVIFCAPENVGTTDAAQEAMDMSLKTLSVGEGPARKGREQMLADLANGPGAAEAKNWLQSSDKHVVTHGTRAEAVRRVVELYSLGARKVTVVEIVVVQDQVRPGDRIRNSHEEAHHVIIEMPDDQASRRKIFDFFAKTLGQNSAADESGQMYLDMELGDGID